MAGRTAYIAGSLGIVLFAFRPQFGPCSFVGLRCCSLFLRNVPPSTALAALFVISRMFGLEFVLSSSENLTIVSLLIL